MKDSYIRDCHIKIKDLDTDIISGQLEDNGLSGVTVRLEGYAIIPIDEYNKLQAIFEKAATAFEE